MVPEGSQVQPPVFLILTQNAVPPGHAHPAPKSSEFHDRKLFVMQLYAQTESAYPGHILESRVDELLIEPINGTEMRLSP
jgi:hypothetical protein